MSSDQGEIYQCNGVALDGVDVVAYFEQRNKIVGNPKYALKYSGLEWRFSTKTHQERFNARPKEYIPQYGGFCAFGVGKGYKAKPKLSTFTIYNQKLYLNFSDYVKDRWLESMEENIISADNNWGEIKNSIPIKANRYLIYIKYRLLLLFGIDTLS